MQAEIIPPLSEFVVTIDGPAGAGKSSVARHLAAHFGFDFLDTGAMYRVVTLACINAGVELTNEHELIHIAENLEIGFAGDKVCADGRDVSADIRTPVVNANIRYVADNEAIRRMLGGLQVRIASGKCIVTEGRDQGTEVFPDAACKIFLTATPETRARRRHLELLDRGHAVDYQEVLATQQQRDLEDSQRPVGALRPADDAKVFYTDGMSQDEVVSALAKIVLEKMPERLER